MRTYILWIRRARIIFKAFDIEFILTEDTGVKSDKKQARPKEILCMLQDHNCQQYLTNMVSGVSGTILQLTPRVEEFHYAE